MIKRIVLTGGPCAGKTTSIQRIVEEFEEKGLNVYVVPEAATLLINMGLRPFGKNALTTLEFQKLIFDISFKLEKIAEAASKRSDKDSIILFDRGLLDSKAYLSEHEWKQLLKNYNLKDSSLFGKYDLVLHLRSVAWDKQEFYTLANNNARTESVTDARLLDMNTLHCWLGHPNLKILGNDTTFEEKINKGIEEIYNAVEKPYPIQRQIKYLVGSINEEELYKNTNGVSLNIEQYYIENEDTETFFRKITKNNEQSFKMITKKDTDINNERITTQKGISEKEYYSNFSKGILPVEKTRYCFEYNNCYYRLDTFDDGMKVLEIEETNKTVDIDIPPFIQIEKEISNDKKYRNSYIYKMKNKIDQ